MYRVITQLIQKYPTENAEPTLTEVLSLFNIEGVDYSGENTSNQDSASEVASNNANQSTYSNVIVSNLKSIPSTSKLIVQIQPTKQVITY